MIEPGRTNSIPRTMLILCIGLFVMRTAAVLYGTFCQQAPVSLISWQQPKPLDKTRKDLLSKPYLYFFYEESDQLHSITNQVFENMLFHNREIARLIKSEFIPVKVAVAKDKEDGLPKSLSNSFAVYSYPAVYVALPNGKHVQNTSWQSDRMFHAFLSDALLSTITRAANDAMLSADWALACEAYERASHDQRNSNFSNLTEAIFWSIALRHQKNETKAKEVLEAEQRKQKLPSFLAGEGDWPAPCADYLQGKISRDDLVKSVTTQGDKYGYKAVMVHYVCGADLLLRGKKEEAIKDLKLAGAKRSLNYLSSASFACAELRALGDTSPSVERGDDFSVND